MFEVDTLVASCRESLLEGEPRRVVRDILVRTLERPGLVAERLGRSEGGLEVLFNSPQMTVLNVVWAPRMSIYPHDHRKWAVIGIYGGAEDNTLFPQEPASLGFPAWKADSDALDVGRARLEAIERLRIFRERPNALKFQGYWGICLLYTSDAADE